MSAEVTNTTISSGDEGLGLPTDDDYEENKNELRATEPPDMDPKAELVNENGEPDQRRDVGHDQGNSRRRGRLGRHRRRSRDHRVTRSGRL